MQADKKTKDAEKRVNSLKEQLRRSRIERRRQAAEVQEVVCQAAEITCANLPPVPPAAPSPPPEVDEESGITAIQNPQARLEACKQAVKRSKANRANGAQKLKRTVQALKTYRETEIMDRAELRRRLEADSDNETLPL